VTTVTAKLALCPTAGCCHLVNSR